MHVKPRIRIVMHDTTFTITLNTHMGEESMTFSNDTLAFHKRYSSAAYGASRSAILRGNDRKRPWAERARHLNRANKFVRIATQLSDLRA